MLLFSLAISHCQSLFVYTGFELNRDYIAKNCMPVVSDYSNRNTSPMNIRRSN